MLKSIIQGSIAAAVGLTALASPGQSATSTMLASWYGPGFHGNYTANGEVYDQMGLTAAHKTLPSAHNYVFATKDAWMYISMIVGLSLVPASLICLKEQPKQSD